jgi:hypothetical protein
MSMVDGLLEQLRLRGLAVAYRDEHTLALVGPAAERTPEVMAAVKAFKPDLLARLRPRDYAAAADVHHRPTGDTSDGPETCQECKSRVWDPQGAAALCDFGRRCPMRGSRHG